MHRLTLLMQTTCLIKSTARYPSDAMELSSKTLACDVSWRNRLPHMLIIPVAILNAIFARYIVFSEPCEISINKTKAEYISLVM